MTAMRLSYRDKGYIKEFDTWARFREFVSGKPILSKLGLREEDEVQPGHRDVHNKECNNSKL